MADLSWDRGRAPRRRRSCGDACGTPGHGRPRDGRPRGPGGSEDPRGERTARRRPRGQPHQAPRRREAPRNSTRPRRAALGHRRHGGPSRRDPDQPPEGLHRGRVGRHAPRRARAQGARLARELRRQEEPARRGASHGMVRRLRPGRRQRRMGADQRPRGQIPRWTRPARTPRPHRGADEGCPGSPPVGDERMPRQHRHPPPRAIGPARSASASASKSSRTTPPRPTARRRSRRPGSTRSSAASRAGSRPTPERRPAASGDRGAAAP